MLGKNEAICSCAKVHHKTLHSVPLLCIRPQVGNEFYTLQSEFYSASNFTQSPNYFLCRLEFKIQIYTFFHLSEEVQIQQNTSIILFQSLWEIKIQKLLKSTQRWPL